MSARVPRGRTRATNARLDGHDSQRSDFHMTAILELAEVRERVSPLSVEEYYHRLGEHNDHGKRTELIRGIIIEKMSKSPRHNALSTQLYKRILAALPDGYTARKEEPLTFVDSEPEPDISVLRGQDSDFSSSHPESAELVVEIAVSSAALDREIASLYAEAQGSSSATSVAWKCIGGRKMAYTPKNQSSVQVKLSFARWFPM
jgi:hypothetical protein